MESQSLLDYQSSNHSESKINENIDSKLKERNNYFTKQESIKNIRDESINDGISLRKTSRNSEFDSRRRFSSVKIDQSKSMEDFSHFDKEFKDKAENIIIDKSKIDEYVIYLLNGSIEDQYLSLVAIRKLLSICNFKIIKPNRLKLLNFIQKE